jgi:hypothetical protein
MLTTKQIMEIARPFHTYSLGDYSFNFIGFAEALIAAMQGEKA